MKHTTLLQSIFILFLFGGISFFAFFHIGRAIAKFISETKKTSVTQTDISQKDNDIQNTAYLLPPSIADIIPKNEEKDVFVSMERPIIVRFKYSIKDFYVFFNVQKEGDDTPLELAFENNPEKTEFRLLPKSPLEDESNYSLTISYRKRGGNTESYTSLSKTRFTTIGVAPNDWGNGNDRLAIARKYTQPKTSDGRYIDIDINHQVMTLFENGKYIKNYLISSGLPGLDTPKGEFKIENKAPRPWSKKYSLFMPNWMAITGDGKFGIHELPEWPGGYKEGVSHLGRKASHGCVRLGEGAAKTVYEWTDIGTKVLIY